MTGEAAATATPGAVPVLMYHQIAGDQPSAQAVPPAAFAAQLAHLAAAGFTAVTAGQLGAWLAGRGGPLPARPVVLTFDDGYADFHETALPLLARHGFTATLFATTGWLRPGRGPRLSEPGPAPMLSWGQLAEAAAAGIEIGAHSHRHPQLDQLSAGALREELACSKELLEDGLGRPVDGLAYPYGYSSRGVRRAVADAGYQYACAVRNALARPGSDPLTVQRLTIKRSTGLDAFARTVAGRRIPLTYLADRSLTRGYALVRRARALGRQTAPSHQ